MSTYLISASTPLLPEHQPSCLCLLMLALTCAGLALHGTLQVFDCSWSGDSRRLLSVGSDGRARLWDAAAGSELCAVSALGTCLSSNCYQGQISCGQDAKLTHGIIKYSCAPGQWSLVSQCDQGAELKLEDNSPPCLYGLLLSVNPAATKALLSKHSW